MLWTACVSAALRNTNGPRPAPAGRGWVEVKPRKLSGETPADADDLALYEPAEQSFRSGRSGWSAASAAEQPACVEPRADRVGGERMAMLVPVAVEG